MTNLWYQLFYILGKSANIWDTLTHERPYLVQNRSNADIACDSYHLYSEDVEMLKELGVSTRATPTKFKLLLPRATTLSLREVSSP